MPSIWKQSLSVRQVIALTAAGLIATAVACGGDSEPTRTPIQPSATPVTQQPTATAVPANPTSTASPTPTIAASPPTSTPTPQTASSPSPTVPVVPTNTPPAGATSTVVPTFTPTPVPQATPTTPAPTPTPGITFTPGVVNTVTLGASQDNTLYQSVTGGLSNGAGMGMFVGLTNNQSIRRALVQFDIASRIPAGSTIESVELRLSLTKTATQSQPVAVHRVTSAWGEGSSDAAANEGGGAPAAAGDATWTHRISPDQLWQNPGGDFLPDASAQINVIAINSYTWQSTPQLVADVQAWVNNPGSNFGWVLRGDEVESKSAKRFGTRENPFDSSRPKLVIMFTPPA